MPRASLFAFVSVAALVACTREVPPRPAPAPRIIEVGSGEYAFQVADTVDPGPVILRLRNSGKVLHEMVVMRLKPGITLDTLVKASARSSAFQPFIEDGSAVLFAPPGVLGSGELAVTLDPGRDYVLWCNFRNGEGKPEHSTLGMIKRIHVRDAQAPAVAAAPRVVEVLGSDYAFRAPDTLAAGPVELRFRNTGAHRHELTWGRLKPGVTPAAFYKAYLAGEDVLPLYDDDGAVLTAYPGEGSVAAIHADLQPGRSYVLTCEFSDAPGAKAHGLLGMFHGLEVSR